MNINHITSRDYKQLYNQLRKSAKKRDIPFELTLTEFNDITIPITCPVLGIPIFFHRGRAESDSISFDRIDSSKGYTVENLIVVSNRVNTIKSNATLLEIELIAGFYRVIDL